MRSDSAKFLVLRAAARVAISASTAWASMPCASRLRSFHAAALS